MCFSEQFLADVIFTGVQMKLFWGRRKRNLAKWGRGGGLKLTGREEGKAAPVAVSSLSFVGLSFRDLG